jgi:hypothetical protein
LKPAGCVRQLDNGTHANGRFDSDEKFATTDDAGNYQFLLHAGAYRIAELAQDRWVRTAPAAGYHTVDVIPGETASDLNFGAHTTVGNSSAAPAGEPFQVNTTTGNMHSAAAVASDDAGNSIVTWQSFEQDGSDWGIFAQRYDSLGRRLGGEFRVNSTTGGDQVAPAIATDARGDFIITWANQLLGGSGWDVRAQRYDRQGRRLAGEFRVNFRTTAATTASWVPAYAGPSVAMDDGGDFVIAWHTDPASAGSGADIYAQRFSRTGSRRGGEFRVNAVTEGEQSDPSIALDASGDFIVAWTSFTADFSSVEIRARRYREDGRSIGNEFRVAVDGWSPSVAMDDVGDFAVAWASSACVYVQRYNATAVAQGGAMAVSSPGSFASSPSVAMDRDGDFVVAWHGYGYSGYGYGGYGGSTFGYGGGDVCGVGGGGYGGGAYFVNSTNARRYNSAGVPQGDAIAITIDRSGWSGAPAVAIDGDGDFVIAWEDVSYGLPSEIYAQRYAVDPV